MLWLFIWDTSTKSCLVPRACVRDTRSAAAFRRLSPDYRMIRFGTNMRNDYLGSVCVQWGLGGPSRLFASSADLLRETGQGAVQAQGNRGRVAILSPVLDRMLANASVPRSAWEFLQAR
jgi:hypothetical protein